MVIIRDISERKQAEEALRESEEKYRNVVERANDGIGVGQDQILRYVNPRLAQMLGYSVEELIGSRFADFFIPDEVPKVVDRYKRRLAGENVPPVYESALRHKDGSRIEVELNAGIVTYQGKPADLVLVRDITDRKQMEAKLRESQERFKIAAQSTSDLIWEWNILNGRLEWFGPIDELLGYSQNEFPRTIEAWKKAIHPDDHDRVMTAVDQHLKEQMPYDEEYRMQCKDGTSRYWIDRGIALRDSQGNPLRMVGACTDITERKRAEEALQQSERKYRTVVEIFPDGIAIASKGRHVFANRGLANIFGVSSPDELLGKPVMDYIHPDYRRIVGELIEQQISRGVSVPLMEEKMLRADGTVIYTEVIAAPLEYEGEQALLAVIRDVTERKKAEEALRESEERFRLAFENANTGVCLVDLKGNLTRVNNKMCEIFGYTKEELEHMTVNDIAHPEDVSLSPAFIQKTLRGKTDRGTFEKRYIHKKGHGVTCQLSSSLVRDASGSPLYFISHLYDITEHKRAEEALRQSEERYRTILEDIEEGYFETDLAGRFTFLNDSMCRIHGYPREEFRGTDNRRFVDKENAKKAFEAFNQVYRTGEPGRVFE